MPTQEPLVSVVTPVYNGEKHLAACIESVLAQQYGNWEYIVVNNCSSDTSLEIAQRYARADPRVTVRTNDRFLRAIENHNHALRQISSASAYCKVVHADDWLFPACLRQMVDVAEANPSVGIVGAYRLDDRWVDLDGLPYPSTVVPGREVCRLQLLSGIYVFGSPTSLLIRSDIVRARDRFYDESHPWADTEACYEILREWDFGFVHQVLTATRRHRESYSASVGELNTKMLGRLALLKKFGPIYLDDEEYQERLARVLAAHYEFLGKNVFYRRGRAFWGYHRQGMDSLGHPLHWWRLAAAALRVVAGVALRPWSVARRTVETRSADRNPKVAGG
jgi:glycosyltransferase involved in cell wall biosynthesis